MADGWVSIFDGFEDPFVSVFDGDRGLPQTEHGRPGRIFGLAKLSVQASEFNYCEPRTSGLPLKAYESVEIALIRLEDGAWLRPSDLIGYDGPSDNDCNFGSDDVAGWVPQDVVRRLELALCEWQINGCQIKIGVPKTRSPRGR